MLFEKKSSLAAGAVGACACPDSAGTSLLRPPGRLVLASHVCAEDGGSQECEEAGWCHPREPSALTETAELASSLAWQHFRGQPPPVTGPWGAVTGTPAEAWWTYIAHREPLLLSHGGDKCYLL